MIEFELAGKNYRADKLNAFAQFHVSRKIAPLLPALIPVFVQIQKAGGIGQDLGALADAITAPAEAIANMQDDTAEYVLATCLSAVKRKQGEVWAPIWSESARGMMFDDIDAGLMTIIAIRVIQDSIGPFIGGLLTSHMTTPESTSGA